MAKEEKKCPTHVNVGIFNYSAAQHATLSFQQQQNVSSKKNKLLRKNIDFKLQKKNISSFLLILINIFCFNRCASATFSIKPKCTVTIISIFFYHYLSLFIFIINIFNFNFSFIANFTM